MKSDGKGKGTGTGDGSGREEAEEDREEDAAVEVEEAEEAVGDSATDGEEGEDREEVADGSTREDGIINARDRGRGGMVTAGLLLPEAEAEEAARSSGVEVAERSGDGAKAARTVARAHSSSCSDSRGVCGCDGGREVEGVVGTLHAVAGDGTNERDTDRDEEAVVVVVVVVVEVEVVEALVAGVDVWESEAGAREETADANAADTLWRATAPPPPPAPEVTKMARAYGCDSELLYETEWERGSGWWEWEAGRIGSDESEADSNEAE
jgi:hypothetical protein